MYPWATPEKVVLAPEFRSRFGFDSRNHKGCLRWHEGCDLNLSKATLGLNSVKNTTTRRTTQRWILTRSRPKCLFISWYFLYYRSNAWSPFPRQCKETGTTTSKELSLFLQIQTVEILATKFLPLDRKDTCNPAHAHQFQFAYLIKCETADDDSLSFLEQTFDNPSFKFVPVVWMLFTLSTWSRYVDHSVNSVLIKIWIDF